MPNYFLAKTDPKTYSIDNLAGEGETNWDGVHNYQAVNVIKSWQIGDKVLIYHSQGETKIVGLAEVSGLPKKDDKDKRGISWQAKLKFVRKYPEDEQVTLKEIKETGLFGEFVLIKQGRLSTMACPTKFVIWLEKRGLNLN